MVLAEIWKNGGSLVITLPTPAVKYYNLKAGDIIDFEIKQVKEKNLVIE